MDINTLILLLFVFLLSTFLGFEIISRVPSKLHTPLMSGANAIHGITILGAMVAAGMAGNDFLEKVLALSAVVFATINVVGGFTVTDRMLAMFKGSATNKQGGAATPGEKKKLPPDERAKSEEL